MIDLYKKYYLEERDIISIISNGIIVFDTSALLDIYYYSEESQTHIFDKVRSELNGRLWIPAQCYFEFLKNKGTVIGKPRRFYEELLDDSDKNKGFVPHIVSLSKEFGKKDIEKITGLLKTLKETTTKKDKHPYLNQELFIELDESIKELEKQINFFSNVVEKFNTNIRNEIKQIVNDLPTETDNVQQFIDNNFEIGEELSFDKMIQISEEGRVRYSEKIPPGYEDDNKIGLQKYGDLFVWKEILQMAEKKNKDVVLISNDVKSDWWDEEQKAPRYELLKEFESKTKKNFWCCSMNRFLYYMNNLMEDDDNKIPEKTINEVDDISKKIFEDSLKMEILRGALDWVTELIKIGDEVSLKLENSLNQDNPDIRWDKYVVFSNALSDMCQKYHNEVNKYSLLLDDIGADLNLKKVLHKTVVTYTEGIRELGELYIHKPDTTKSTNINNALFKAFVSDIEKVQTEISKKIKSIISFETGYFIE